MCCEAETTILVGMEEQARGLGEASADAEKASKAVLDELVRSTKQLDALVTRGIDDELIRTGRRIAFDDQYDAYRRMVLGLTMAEVGILIIFVLLLLLVTTERER